MSARGGERRLARALTAAACITNVLVVSGCKTHRSTGAEVTVTSASLPTQDGGVARYDDETPVDSRPLTVKSAVAIVVGAVPAATDGRRTADGSLGPPLARATLRRGDVVFALAEHGGFYRVAFPAPFDSARATTGWVAKYVFEEAATASSEPAPGPSGATPAIPSVFGAARGMNGKCAPGFAAAPKLGPLCYRSCQKDTECPQASACKVTAGVKLCRAD